MQQSEQDTLSHDESKLDKILNRLETLEQRQRKIEAQQKKMLTLQTKGRTYSDQEKEEQLKIKLGQKVANSPNGVTTQQVMNLFDCSKPTALKKMRDLDKKSEKIDYASGKGRKADRLVHRRFGVGRMC